MKFRKLNASEIDARVSTVTEKGCSVLLYKDARVDMNILDETVGPERWQRAHEVIDGNLYCQVGIWVDRREDGYGEWVWKQDVGTESYTEKEKGQASDSFKRACFNWGIGRELYTAPFIWIGAEKVNLQQNRDGKYTTKDRFKVTDIGYDEKGNINKLTVINEKSGTVVYSYGEAKTDEERMIQSGKNTLSLVQVKAVRNSLQKMGKSEEGMCEYFGISSIEDMTIEQMAQFNKMIEDIKKGQK